MRPWAIRLLLMIRCLVFSDGFSAKELTFSSFALAKTKEKTNGSNSLVVDSYLLRILSLNKQQKQRVTDDENPSPLAEAFRTILVDVPEERAKTAAIVVETLAVDRHTKRQWRRFLKERQDWMGDTPATSSSSPTGSSGTLPLFSVDEDLKNAERVMVKLVEYGLNGRDIAEIMIHTPQVAFIEPETSLTENLERLNSLLMGRSKPHELGMRKYDARKILREAPGLLTGSGSKAAEGVVDLMINLGVSKVSLLHDKKALTKLLRRQPAAIFRLVAFLSSDAVRMPLSAIGPLLRRSICQPLLDAVASYEEPPDALSRQLQRAVLSDLYSRMSRTAYALRYEVGADNLTNVIASFPGVLLIDADRQILPMANYLMNDLGIFKDDLPRILRLYPVLLRMDLEQVQNVIQYLLSLDVPEDRLGAIVRAFPSLLTLEIEHDMEPVVSFLRDEVGVNNVGRFITRLPPVLGYSVAHDLRPKYTFLSSAVADPLFEVSKFPAYFSYPLERIVFRFAYLRQKRKLLVPLDEVLRFGDYDFCHQVAGDKNTRSFKEFVSKRKDRVKEIMEKTYQIPPPASNDSEESIHGSS